MCVCVCVCVCVRACVRASVNVCVSECQSVCFSSSLLYKYFYITDIAETDLPIIKIATHACKLYQNNN